MRTFGLFKFASNQAASTIVARGVLAAAVWFAAWAADGTIRAINGTTSQRNAMRLAEVSVRFDMWISTFLR